MIEGGEQSCFPLEACQPFRVRREVPREDLDRHVATQGRVARAIHLAHAADVEQSLDAIRTDRRAWREPRRGRRDELGHERANRRVDHSGRRLRQQGLDLAPQRGIVRARAREKRVALGWRPLASLMKQPFDLAQALRRHVQPRGSIPAAATPGRTPSRAARFSTRPGARRRSRRRSTRRRIAARRRGSCGRPGRRAPSAHRPAGSRPHPAHTPPIAASSNVTRTAPPPRLSAPRDRARSTSTRRINRADIARKCVRFCQSTCWTSTRRRKASLTNSVACTLWFARSPCKHRRAMRRNSSWTSGINASRAVSSPSRQALRRTVTSWVGLKTAAF